MDDTARTKERTAATIERIKADVRAREKDLWTNCASDAEQQAALLLARHCLSDYRIYTGCEHDHGDRSLGGPEGPGPGSRDQAQHLTECPPSCPGPETRALRDAETLEFAQALFAAATDFTNSERYQEICLREAGDRRSCVDCIGDCKPAALKQPWPDFTT